MKLKNHYNDFSDDTIIPLNLDIHFIKKGRMLFPFKKRVTCEIVTR